MERIKQGLALLMISALLAACGGGSSAPGGTASEGPGPGQTGGSLSLRLDTTAIPRVQLQTASPETSSDTSFTDAVVIEILNPQTLIPIHPTSVFDLDRSQAVQSLLITGIVPGTHTVRIVIYDSGGLSFFSGQQQARVNPGESTVVAFSGSGGTGEGPPVGATVPSAAFLCVENADDEQGQPDVALNDSGFFVVVGRVTDAPTRPTPQAFLDFGFVHAERFQANFATPSASSIDETNGNDGDFDISQYATLINIDSSADDLYQPLFPRVDVNSLGAFVVGWFESNPNPATGATPVVAGSNPGREPVVRAVLLDENAITSPNTNGETEPNNDAVLNIAGPSAALASGPAVVITEPSANFSNQSAVVVVHPESSVLAAKLSSDGGQSASIPANGLAPQNLTDLGTTNVFDLAVGTNPPEPPNFGLAIRKTIFESVGDGPFVVVGPGVNANQVIGQISDEPPGQEEVINAGQPSNDPSNNVAEVAGAVTESGLIFAVYSVSDPTIPGTTLYGRLFDGPADQFVGPEFVIAQAAANFSHRYPDVAVINGDNSFLVTWTEFDASNNQRVLLRRVSSTGTLTPSAGPLQVDLNEPLAVANLNKFSRVSATSNGDGVVVWQTGDDSDTVADVRILGKLYPTATTQ